MSLCRDMTLCISSTSNRGVFSHRGNQLIEYVCMALNAVANKWGREVLKILHRRLVQLSRLSVVASRCQQRSSKSIACIRWWVSTMYRTDHDLPERLHFPE